MTAEMTLEPMNNTIFPQKLLSAALEFRSDDTWAFKKNLDVLRWFLFVLKLIAALMNRRE